LNIELTYIFHGYFVVDAIDKMVIFLLVDRNPELARDIILKLVVVSVEVVLGDIGQYADIRSKRLNIIQLKAADLGHIQRLWIFGNLARK